MPELPEVQTVVSDLLKLNIVGRRIKIVKVLWPATANFSSQLRLNGFFRGKRIQGITRRGKFIVFDLNDGGKAALHLRMSGRLRYVGGRSPLLKHEHLRIIFDANDELRFHDPRKFGRFYFGKDAENKLSALGIEPLERAFGVSLFQKILAGRKRCLKPLLLDQSFIAGLGNICVDESLWAAHLHPQRLSSTLSDDEVRCLHGSIRAFLKKAVKNGGTSLGEGESNFISVSDEKGRNKTALKVYGRRAQSCLNCGKPVVRIVVGQRSTYLCENCQKLK